MIKYIWKVIIWQIKHRNEKNNRQKQRRFDKEVGEFKPQKRT